MEKEHKSADVEGDDDPVQPQSTEIVWEVDLRVVPAVAVVANIPFRGGNTEAIGADMPLTVLITSKIT